ncbi:MAG: 4-hydroxy-tetrahydrodipicolinate reductase, partial [Firmicutes bacterium]|nr:4-hydroxy-tetrahydrodipicolinate reductase [Candidatus Caballimonas caccae]
MNILISGALGKMGKKAYEATLNENEVKVVAGIDIKDDASLPYPIYDSFSKVKEKVDVIIDFSRPNSLDNILDYAIKNKINAVLCTTGYNEEDVKKIKSASEKIAIFRSGNMSLGVNVLIDLVKKANLLLENFDIEIIEAHHNQKVDAPSGTALMIADSIKEQNPDNFYTYGRKGNVGKRDKKEIGIHAIRGGNIVGKHQVIFAGENETITITHEASDRGVFAVGAVKASKFLFNKDKGLFSMND